MSDRDASVNLAARAPGLRGRERFAIVPARFATRAQVVSKVPMPRPQQAEPSAFHYRPDIDGLRAIAVVPVVLYHFGVPWFSGGFVGVDVFFVISGFLITSLIDVEIQAGRFSIVNFYERRVRRILPPLIVVVAAAMVVSLILLFPADLKRFAESVIAVTVFSSNVEFWRESGYFDAGSSVKPLLHTWSLAVEEQFYLFFPPTLMLLNRFFRRGVGLMIVGAIFVLSFGISIWSMDRFPDLRFLSSLLADVGTGTGCPARAWRAAGASRQMLCTALAGLGLLLILYSIFFVSAVGFPGYMALVPCLGTALILYAGMAQTTPVSAALATRPMVGVGLISYSFYLWHWPIFVFARYDRFDAIPLWQTAFWIALSALLATLSWRYVERPIRKRTILKSRKSLFLAAFAGMALLAICGAGIIAAHELPQRFPKDIQAILKAEHDYEPRRNTCFDRKMSLGRQGRFLHHRHGACGRSGFHSVGRLPLRRAPAGRGSGGGASRTVRSVRRARSLSAVPRRDGGEHAAALLRRIRRRRAEDHRRPPYPHGDPGDALVDLCRGHAGGHGKRRQSLSQGRAVRRPVFE